jgi:hypothetical protein
MTDLSRPLSATESQWLAQHSLICLDAKLSPETAAAATEESLALALARTRTLHPYLSVSIDTEQKAFRPAPATPLSLETLDTDGGDGALPAGAVRAAAQRQLAAGVDRAQTLARAHLVCGSGGEQHKHLLLLCDHLALDARSLTIWLGGIMAALLGGDAGHQQQQQEAMHEFVDWTDRIPTELSFAPFEPHGRSVALDKLEPAPEALAAVPVPGVADLVVCVEPAVFAALKGATKGRQTTLNAPLSAAFAAAVLDAARKEHPDDVVAPAYVQGCCAVDARAHVTPPLPSNYMNNSSSVVPTHATFTAGASLWQVAAAAQAELLEAIAAHEVFRLQDITKRAAFAEFGPIFSIPALWSNCGHISAPGVAAAEVHIAGAATNPVISGHVTEANGHLALTVTYSPLFYGEETPRYIAERFVHHCTQLSTGDADTPYW